MGLQGPIGRHIYNEEELVLHVRTLMFLYVLSPSHAESIGATTTSSLRSCIMKLSACLRRMLEQACGCLFLTEYT